jgi:hypothetical protein
MMRAPKIHSLVVFNHTLEATLFRIVKMDGYRIGVIDTTIEDSHPNQAIQWVDRSMLLGPSIGQLKGKQS